VRSSHLRCFVALVTPTFRPVQRVEIDVRAMPPGKPYSVLNTCVVPRPIAWVSTVSAAGVRNLAPHSYFSIVSAAPPVICFTSVGDKDTLRNVREVPEMVVHVATEALLHRVNETGTSFGPHIDELAEVGLTAEPSVAVRPVRIAESPVALECSVVGFHEFPTSTVIFGEVVHAAFDPSVLAADGLPDTALLRPVSRLGRNEWGTLGEVLRINRIPVDDWPTHQRQ
jgi:flavin reductase (DIM6/NTAB) family NADH-FMN oxidoreductase RutF